MPLLHLISHPASELRNQQRGNDDSLEVTVSDYKIQTRPNPMKNLTCAHQTLIRIQTIIEFKNTKSRQEKVGDCLSLHLRFFRMI